MSYIDDIDHIAAEGRRRSAMLRQELDEIHRSTAERGRQFAERTAAQMRDFWDEHREEIEKARVEAEEQERREAEERQRQEALAAEAREQSEAIARSMAARRANDVVAPSDEEDEEAAFYQRKSWLI